MSNLAADEKVLGYTLIERIGHGGYGEVWCAEAPGGLRKAIKFVYGFHDEDRAQRELKALSRIKDLRHPFLLSLERIDIIEGRLVIVTELADMSVKERFDHYREKGFNGIPRNELLGYLSDVADALDYINQTHSLQHLDVKPENLLIVGGHAKLADFGLVKNLHETQQSFMGGLTPTYAPPELFDGTPSDRSDQYSLAVVYQEMLTGKRPFPGRTAAQLAAQHTGQEPNLDGLSRGDKIVVGRALQKNPAGRFASCHEFTSQLQCRTISRSDQNAARRSTRSKRSSRDEEISTDLTNTLRTSVFNHSFVGETKQLPPLEIDFTKAEFQPTLFISVGETATSIMRSIRKRMRDGIGGFEETPAIRFLCIDTDTKSLRNACNESPNGSLYFDDILPMPLRTPMEYREDASVHTTWLSRRWIYNVPKSQQTEGIRPLGRLAFADHHQELFDRLHDLVESISQAEVVGRTAEAIGMVPAVNPTPRVFVVGSISGGAGSGMIIDLAYAIRAVLIEQGHANAKVNGILTYTSGRTASHKNLSMANAFTCLTELYHFDVHAPYPGDATCKLPAFDDDRSTFDSTYLVDMSAEMLPEEYSQTVDSIAEYLYLNTATKCAPFFERCREEYDEETYTFRSLGLSTAAELMEHDNEFLRKRLLERLFQTWAKDGEPSLADVDKRLKDRMKELDFSLESLVRQVNETIALRFNKNPDIAVASAVADHIQHSARENLTLDQLIQAMHSAIAGAQQERSRFAKSLDFALSEVCATITRQVGNELVNVVLGQLDHAGYRVSGAATSAQRCLAFLENMTARLQLIQASTRSELRTIADSLIHSDDLSESDKDGQIVELGQLYLQEFVLGEANKIIQSVRDRVDSVTQTRIKTVRSNLELLRRKVLGSSGTEYDETAHDAHIPRLMIDHIVKRIDDLTSLADHRVQGRSLTLLARQEAGDEIDHLTSQLRHVTSSVISDAMKEIDFEKVLESSELDGEKITNWLKRHLALSQPELLGICGGEYRLLLAIPERSHSELLTECLEHELKVRATVIPATSGSLSLCTEANKLSLKSVLLDLIRKRPDCVEYVARLHARNDIEWKLPPEIVS